jgi:hypothetical protein
MKDLSAIGDRLMHDESMRFVEMGKSLVEGLVKLQSN